MEYSEVGKMKISDVFSITNRGIVLSGEIITGEICEGNYFKLNFEGRELIYKIDSVESFRTEAAAKIGLLIKPENNSELSYIEKTIGQSMVILAAK